jgi:hypothetical protein
MKDTKCKNKKKHKKILLDMRPLSQALCNECIPKRGLNEVKQNLKSRKG